MKQLFVLFLSSLSFMAIGGGVTIGNGSSYIVGIDLPAFREEVELLQFTKGLIDETRSGRLLRVREFKRQGNCAQEYTEFKGLDAFDFYPNANAQGLGERYVKGQLIVELYNCKTPGQIDHDGFEEIDLDNILEL